MAQTHSTDPPSHLHRLSVCRTTPPTAAASRSSRARTARPTCTRGATASSCSRARRTSTCGCAPAGTRRLTIDVELDPSTVSQINLHLLHQPQPPAHLGECMCSPGECSTPTHITTRTPPLLPPPPCCARNNSGDAVIFDNRLLHRGCRKSQANLRHRARLDADPVARPGVAAVPKARPIWPTNRGRLHKRQIGRGGPKPGGCPGSEPATAGASRLEGGGSGRGERRLTLLSTNAGTARRSTASATSTTTTTPTIATSSTAAPPPSTRRASGTPTTTATSTCASRRGSPTSTRSCCAARSRRTRWPSRRAARSSECRLGLGGATAGHRRLPRMGAFDGSRLLYTLTQSHAQDAQDADFRSV